MGMNQINTPLSSSPHTGMVVDFPYRRQPWYAAYMDALFEPERSQIPPKIRHAVKSILARERELLAEPAEFAERRALNNARHALRALSSCLQL